MPIGAEERVVTVRPDPDLDRIVSLREAARLRSVSVDTLRRNAARGLKPRIIELSPRRRGCRLREVLQVNE